MKTGMLSCLLLFWAGIAAAQDKTDFVNIFDVFYTQDSNESNAGGMGIAVQMYESAEFSVNFGTETISDSAGDIDIDSYGAGLATLNGEQMDIGLFYNFWGKEEELTIHTWTLPVTFYLLDWTVGITPEHRDISLWTNNFSGVRHKIGIQSKGIQTRVTHHRLFPFEWWIEYADYSYNRELSSLNTRLAALLFSNTSLQLSSSFVDHRTAMAMRYHFDTVQLELSFGQSLSAVDGSHTDNFELSTLIKFSELFSIKLSAGVTRPETGEEGEYGAISIQLKD